VYKKLQASFATKKSIFGKVEGRRKEGENNYLYSILP
jgi:hypothetical protein